MRVLFDQGTPKPLRAFLSGFEVRTAFQEGWATLSNGDLLNAAEKDGFQILVSTDQNLRYQQNLSKRVIALVILPTTRWSDIKSHGELVRDALLALRPGGYVELDWD